MKILGALSTLVCGSVCVSALPAFAGTGLETSFGLNQATIERTVYEGQCPGETENSVEAFFTSSSTLGAAGRRVVVRNVTASMDSDSIPYTDRAYTAARSEHTFLALDHKHRVRTLSVAEGLNDFQYEITDRDGAIVKGVFQLNVNVVENRVIRNMECRWEVGCQSGPIGNPPFPVCRNVWTCSCPF